MECIVFPATQRLLRWRRSEVAKGKDVMQPEDDDEACALAVLTRATFNGEREQLGLLKDEILFGQGFPHLPVSLYIWFTRGLE